MKTSTRKILIIVVVFIAIIGAGLWMFNGSFWQSKPSNQVTEQSAPTATHAPTPTVIKGAKKTISELVEKYRDLKLTDAHNHGADGKYTEMMDTWKRNAIARVVLFGHVSFRSSVETDKIAWTAYEQNPDFFIPYFSGIDLNDKLSLDVVKANLEKGYFGIGEVAAASTNSPILSKAPWKTKDPMDGYLPQIYDIAANYKVPVLLHIDPPSGKVIDKLEEALDSHTDTIFVFAHINVYNYPQHIKPLLEKHKNLYADLYAGFTELDPGSGATLEDFVPLIKEFPDRFMLATDSGVNLRNEEAAIESMYRMIDLLGDRELAKKVAYDNLDALIRDQPATKTQLEAIKTIAKTTGKTYELSQMSKLEAGRIIIESKKD